MKKTKLLQKTISKLVDVSFKDGKMIESQVIKSIKSLKNLSKIDAIWALTEYLGQIKRKQRQHTMYVESVVPLSPSQIKKVKKLLEKKVKITRVITSINPEILGGFKLKVGDSVWDESLVGKLEQIKEVIAHGRSD